MGKDGAITASTIAKKNGGVTLETILDSQNIRLPKFDYNNPASVQAWRNASKSYANQASGVVKVILGEGMISNSIWNAIELPALKTNANVTKIVVVDHMTRTETIIFTR